MIEIAYKVDSCHTVYIRKSTNNSNRDISGIYNNYPINKIIFLKNEVSIQIRANENKIYVANFAGSAGYYSIFWNDGLSMTEFYKIYKKIAKIETQRWITHCKKPLLKRGFNISSSLQSSLCRYRQGF